MPSIFEYENRSIILAVEMFRCVHVELPLRSSQHHLDSVMEHFSRGKILYLNTFEKLTSDRTAVETTFRKHVWSAFNADLITVAYLFT